MAWCLRCKVEYREGFSVCSDCGSKLVSKKDKKNDVDDGHQRKEEFVLLTTVSQREGDIIISLLNSCGIKVRKKFKEAGAYLDIYAGGSPFGVDIFVEKNKIKEAEKIIEEIPEK